MGSPAAGLGPVAEATTKMPMCDDIVVADATGAIDVIGAHLTVGARAGAERRGVVADVEAHLVGRARVIAGDGTETCPRATCVTDRAAGGTRGGTVLDARSCIRVRAGVGGQPASNMADVIHA